MIRLIRNELSKIYHKKSLAYYSIIVLILTIVIAIANSQLNDFFDNSQSYENNITIYNNALKYYDIKDPGQYEEYKITKSLLMNIDYMKEYPYDSWKSNFVEQNISNLTLDFINAEEEHDEVLAAEIKNEIETKLKEIREHDYLYFMKKEKDENKEEMKRLLEAGFTTKSIEYISAQIKDEGYDYKIKLVSDPDTEVSKRILNEIVTYEDMKYTLEEDKIQNKEKTFVEKKDYLSHKEEYEVAKYKLDNNKFADDSTSSEIMYYFTNPSFYIIIGFAIIASSILAEEFNKGTIKQLLLKPYVRSKIYVSKLITILITLLAFILYFTIINIVVNGFVFGFDKIQDIIIFDNAVNSIKTLNILEYGLIRSLAYLPCYLILALLSYVVSIMFKSGSLAFACPLIGYFASMITDSLFYGSKANIVRFIPSSSWNLTEYLFGGLGTYENMSLRMCIGIDVLILALLFITGFIWFKKTDIKNQ